MCLSRCKLTAGVPDGVGLVLVAVLHALHVGLGVASRHQDLPEERDVRDGKPQGVDLGQPLLVRERGHVAPELLEGRVDAQHPLALPDVGGVSLDLVRWVVVVMGHQAPGASLPAADLGRFVRRRGAVRFHRRRVRATESPVR